MNASSTDPMEMASRTSGFMASDRFVWLDDAQRVHDEAVADARTEERMRWWKSDLPFTVKVLVESQGAGAVIGDIVRYLVDTVGAEAVVAVLAEQGALRSGRDLLRQVKDVDLVIVEDRLDQRSDLVPATAGEPAPDAGHHDRHFDTDEFP